MTYASVEDVKTYLDIDSNSEFKLDFLLNKTKDVIDSMIGELFLGERTELIELDSVTLKGDIFLKNINVVSIDKINGEDYSGVEGKDYFILRPQKRRVRILDIAKYLSNSYSSGIISIEFTSGYESGEVPEDIKMAQCLLVAYYFLKDEGRDVVKYTMGPRTVHYGDSSEIMSDVKKMLKKYKQFNLFVN